MGKRPPIARTTMVFHDPEHSFEKDAGDRKCLNYETNAKILDAREKRNGEALSGAIALHHLTAETLTKPTRNGSDSREPTIAIVTMQAWQRTRPNSWTVKSSFPTNDRKTDSNSKDIS